MDNVRTTASFAGAGLAGRIGIAGGLLAIALVVAFTAVSNNLDHARQKFDSVVNVAQPMAEAAFEMEINTIGAGLAVVHYLNTPDPEHRRRFQKDREDFQKFHRRFRELASTGWERELAVRIEERHAVFTSTGDFLMNAKDSAVSDTAVITALLRDLDNAIENEIEERPIANRRRQAEIAKTVEKLERAIMGIPLIFAGGGPTGANAEMDIAAAILDVIANLAVLERAAPERSAAVKKLAAKFDAIAPRMESLVHTQWEMAMGMDRLAALRDEMCAVLEDEIQVLAGARLHDTMGRTAENFQAGKLVLAAAVTTPLAMLIGMIFYLTRQVVRPIKRLVAYAAEVGRGNFGVSVDVKGAAEVGALARAGVEMVGALQSARDKMNREADERAKMQESLSQTQRMAAIGQLAGGIAHDFNNMMMVMGGHADRAASHIGEPETVAKSIDEIRAAIAKAANVVRRLSIFSGRRALEQKVFQIAEFKDEIDSLIQPSIGKQFAVECEFRDEGARVKCDRSELTQAVLNLVINASHASSPGSTIKIAVDVAGIAADTAPDTRPPIKPGRYAVFSVTDSGTGIPDAVIPRLFEPYFTTKAKGTGTGLGLASVFGFAAQSGGGVAFTTKMGEGTTFRIYLPVTDRPAEVIEAQDSSVPRGHGESILLADDDAKVLELVQEILSELGYAVLAANGAFEAVELASDETVKIDVMLSDVVMPVMSGPEAYDIIKDKRPGLPVIFMSGDTNRFGEVKLPDGAPLLEKPASTASLARALRAALDKRKTVAPAAIAKEPVHA